MDYTVIHVSVQEIVDKLLINTLLNVNFTTSLSITTSSTQVGSNVNIVFA